MNTEHERIRKCRGVKYLMPSNQIGGESVGKHVPNWTQESFEDIRTITSRSVT